MKSYKEIAILIKNKKIRHLYKKTEPNKRDKV